MDGRLHIGRIAPDLGQAEVAQLGRPQRSAQDVGALPDNAGETEAELVVQWGVNSVSLPGWFAGKSTSHSSMIFGIKSRDFAATLKIPNATGDRSPYKKREHVVFQQLFLSPSHCDLIVE